MVPADQVERRWHHRPNSGDLEGVTTTSDPKIFLSYRRDDTRHMAGRLFDRLSDRFGEDNVFIDVTSVEAGIDFGRALEHAVGQCDVLIALIGPSWRGMPDEQGRRRLDDPDDWVAVEIGTALERDVRVIPVLVDGVGAPRPRDLPERLRTLARRSTFRLDHESFPHDSTALLAVVERSLSAPGMDRDETSSHDEPQQVHRPLTPLQSTTAGGGAAAARSTSGFDIDDHFELPESLHISDLVGDPDVDQIRTSWRSSTEGLPAAIGRTAQEWCVVDLVADGANAVVAGTSGSGKSVLVQTVILSLALARGPDELAFLFVDYKGGGTTRDLAKLPHVVGSVTNLDRRRFDRVIASLRAEAAHREAALRSSGSASITEYRTRRRYDRRLPPMPRLVIVVEELAEIRHQQPDLLDALVGLGRTGRSLGFHLLLATQRPAGVLTAELLADVNLRICLRVIDKADSLDVLGVPDAAQLPRSLPGRAIVRGRRSIELIQVAAAELRGRPSSPDTAHYVDRMIAAASSGPPADPVRLFQSPLPDVVTLDEFVPPRLAILVGLHDRLQERTQEPLTLPVNTGHLAIVGSSRSGRTSALRAIGASLAMAATVNELHIHVISTSGELRSLEALPHVGSVVIRDDPLQIKQLLLALAEEVRHRRRLVADRGAADIAELTDEAPPHVVLLIDGWRQVLVDTESTIQRLLLTILEEGLAAGVTVCVTGDERLLSAQLAARFRYRLCLRLDDPASAARAGLTPGLLPTWLPPGRGLWTADGNEVQVPLLDPDPRGIAQSAALDALGRRLHERRPENGWTTEPLRIEPLPERITLAAAAARERTPRPQTRSTIVLGVADIPLRPVRADLRDGPVLVAGPRRSGRSTAIQAVAVAAARSGLRVALISVDHAEAAARAGVAIFAPGHTTDVPKYAPELLAVDDADRTPDTEILLGLIQSNPGLFVCLSAEIDALGFGARGLLRQVHRAAETIVLLSPPNHLSALNVEVRLARGEGFDGPPGRAIFRIRGDQVLGQVATPE